MQEDLSRRGADQVDASDDMRDALVMVVRDDGELVGDAPVASQYDEVSGLGLEALHLRSLEPIAELDGAIVGTQPNRGFRRRAAVAAAARVDNTQRPPGAIGQVLA